MAIPTQFSVTNTRTAPISNPALPLDHPQTLDAENAQVIETNLIGSLSGSIVGAPSIYTADNAAIIDAPSNASARAKANISAPDAASAESKAVIDTPTSANSETAVTIPLPTELTSLAKAEIDGAATIPAENKTAISAPSAKTAANKIDVDTPSAKTAESKAVVNAPTEKTAQAKIDVNAPVEKTAQPKAATDAPNTLSTTSATPLTPPFPLNHARILYNSVLESYSSITASSEAAGFPPINALKPNTYEAWRFTTSASTLQIDFGGPTRAFDMLCIGAHNLGRAGADIQVWYEPEPGGTFVQFDTTKSPAFDQQQHPIVFYSQTAVNALTIEVRITGASGVPSIGYISAGVALQMQRPFFNGHTPITDADVTQYYSNRTESGEIIGQQIRAQGYETSADWQNIDDTWYRTYFAPFKQAAKLRPFFFAWNLLEYPDDVGFCRIAQDVSAPMQNGTRTKRSISMKLLGAG